MSPIIEPDRFDAPRRGSCRFDFAISFAGPDRLKAEALRNELVERQLRVFYDRDYEHEMLGRNGADYLRSIYARDAMYCVVLVSEHYDSSTWAGLERESIQARELRGDYGTLIPIRCDAHIPDWLPETRIYFDLGSRPMSHLVALLERLARSRLIGFHEVNNQDDLYRALPRTTWRKVNDVEQVIFEEGGLLFHNAAGHTNWSENYYQMGSEFKTFTITWVGGPVADQVSVAAPCRLNDDMRSFTELDKPSACVWRLVARDPFSEMTVRWTRPRPKYGV